MGALIRERVEAPASEQSLEDVMDEILYIRYRNRYTENYYFDESGNHHRDSPLFNDLQFSVTEQFAGPRAATGLIRDVTGAIANTFTPNIIPTEGDPDPSIE